MNPMPRSLFPDFDGPPLMNAAGTIKTPDQAKTFLRTPFPAVMLGSYTLEEREGNSGRTFFDTPLGALNSMGLPGPAMETWREWVKGVVPLFHDDGKEVWVSIAGFNPREYRQLAEAALECGADAIELNLGCPNVWDHGEQKPIVSLSVEQTAMVLDEVRPLLLDHRFGAKLSPILDLVVMAEIDKQLSQSGISFLTIINTVPNCYATATDGTPGVTFGKGLAGMSGPAITWLALGQIISHREFVPEIPIVGVGGISRGKDYFDFRTEPVGAAACQVGTAFWQGGIKRMTTILEEIAEISTEEDE